MALVVPLSRFTPQFGGGSAFYVSPHQDMPPTELTDLETKYLDSAKSGDSETVKAMLAAGVNVNTLDDRKTPRNRTALMHAAASGHLDVVDLLINTGAKLEIKDKGVGFDWPGSNTALILAIKNKHIQVANRLLDAGANPKAKAVNTTALRAAIGTGNLDLIQRLVELGADPDQRPSDGISAMLVAILEKNVPVVELFLKKGSDANAQTPGGGWLLTDAVFQGNLQICELLCKYGASPNVQEEDNHFTPLMFAALSLQDQETFRFLLSVGAKVNEVNIRNKTTLDLLEEGCQRVQRLSPSEIQRMEKQGKDTKVILKALDEIKSMLRDAGAKFYNELTAKDAERDNQPETQTKTNNLDHRGTTHFLKFMYDGQPEWSLIAVKAPIDDVSTTFAQLSKAKRRAINVPVKPAGGDGDELSAAVAVVQVKNNPWTIIFRSLLTVDSDEIENVPKEAKELSVRLKSRAITFIGEDTSGAMGYEIYEDGKLMEKAEWEGGGEFFTFKSKLRKKPELEEVGDDYLDAVFSGAGIYLPACYPKIEDGKSWLAVEIISADTIHRADLIEL